MILPKYLINVNRKVSKVRTLLLTDGKLNLLLQKKLFKLINSSILIK